MKIFSNISIILTSTLLIAVMFSPAVIQLDSLDNEHDTVIAHAQEDRPYQFLAPIGGLGDETEDGGRELDVSSEDSFPEYVQTIITITIGFAIMIAIILIIAAGFQYMTSTSDRGVSQAKEQITNAILGLVLALSAVVILQTINPQLIELNSVQTVITTGESFSDELPSENSFKAMGTVTNNDGDVLVEDVEGISDTPALAKSLCETNGKNQAPSSCNISDYVNTFDDNKCTVTCDEIIECDGECESNEEQESIIPTSWDGVEWCAGDDPEANFENCKDRVTTCEAENGDCYAHPLQVDGRITNCDDCVFVDPESYPIKSLTCTPQDASTQDYCRIKSSLSDKLSNLESQLNNVVVSSPLTDHYEVTETFPPTVEHQNDCHYDGSCVDVGLRKSQAEMDVFSGDVNNRYTNDEEVSEEHAQKVIDFINFANSNDLRAEYEVDQAIYQDLIDQISNLGIDDGFSDDIIIVNGVLPHFSVYDN